MSPAVARDRLIAELLTRWFRRNARDLPWRAIDPRLGHRNPYHSLVSEIMLQQTQVARVLERYPAFLKRFPTIQSLARADEQAVLAAWIGMGYYRRAINLHRAARTIVKRHKGAVPPDVESLRALPGVGRYTAGAIASLVFGRREPIVDGNARRVLLRLEGKPLDGDPCHADRRAWSRATSLVHAARDPAPFNEGLMELGATLCTPARPACNRCPLAPHCRFRPPRERAAVPRRGAAKPSLYCTTAIVRDARGRIWVRKRPSEGLWADMWEAPTIERDDRHAIDRELVKRFRLREPRRIAEFHHPTTHRRVHFEVWTARAEASPSGHWVTPRALARLPMSNAQRRALALATLPSK